jgi:hypothetical protein
MCPELRAFLVIVGRSVVLRARGLGGAFLVSALRAAGAFGLLVRAAEFVDAGFALDSDAERPPLAVFLLSINSHLLTLEN